MKHICETIVVEGKYDKIRLSQLVDANIIQTDGFMIFKNQDMLGLLGRLADETGLIVLTDSDAAGFAIRNYIKSCLAGKNVKHAFIPAVHGKERRKEKPGKEGLLGVEGMRDEALLAALERAECHIMSTISDARITKQDLYCLGLSGGNESRKKRETLCKTLNLPPRLSANVLLDVLNSLYTRDSFLEMFDEEDGL